MNRPMGEFRRMLHKTGKKAERMWHRLTGKVEKKLDL